MSCWTHSMPSCLGVLEHFVYGQMPFLTPTLLFSGLGTGSVVCNPAHHWGRGINSNNFNTVWYKITTNNTECLQRFSSSVCLAPPIGGLLLCYLDGSKLFLSDPDKMTITALLFLQQKRRKIMLNMHYMAICQTKQWLTTTNTTSYNEDRAARPPHISIYVHSFGALAKVVSLFTASLHSQPMCPKCDLLTFASTSNWLTGMWQWGLLSFRPPPVWG